MFRRGGGDKKDGKDKDKDKDKDRGRERRKRPKIRGITKSGRVIKGRGVFVSYELVKSMSLNCF